MANSYSLDLESGSSQYASIVDGSQTGLDLANDFSIEAWIRLESTGAAKIIAAKYDLSDRAYSFFVTATNNLQIEVSDDGSNSAGHFLRFTTDSAIDNEFLWNHVAVTFDISAETSVFYLNSSVMSNSITSGTGIGAGLKNSAAPFSLGVWDISGTAARFFDGKIDDVRVWNDIRSGAEIAANYKTELVGNEAGLVGYWKLNNNYLDETTNNNDLTASGGPVFTMDLPFDIKTKSLYYQQI